MAAQLISNIRPRAWSLLVAGLCCANAAMAQVPRAFAAAPLGLPPSPWLAGGLASTNKPVTRFEIVQLDGERVLQVATDKSYGVLQHDLEPSSLQPTTMLRWRWRLDQPLLLSDLTRKSGDDSPLKLCAMFDLPLANVPFVERSLLRLARNAGTKAPGATLCYLWDHALAAGTELNNAFSGQVHFIVIDSGEKNLKQWIPHERNLVQDFMKAFGHQTTTVPPLIGIAVGADSDNTAATSLGYVGDIVLSPQPTPIADAKPAASSAAPSTKPTVSQ